MTASRDEIHRWLRACQNEPWYRQQLGLTWNGLAEAIGISSFALRAARSGATVRKDRGEGGGYVHGVTVEMLAKIERVMVKIEGGWLIFDEGKAIELAVPRHHPWLSQPSLVPDKVWNFWAACRSCWGRKWLPMWLQGQPIIGCLRCNPQNEWSAWGASARQCRLTDRVLAELPVSDETDARNHKNVRLPQREVRSRV